MASFVPPKKNFASGYTFYVSLAPRTADGTWQANPTLATGDVKIAIDDGAPANLGTLPVADADFTKRVKVVLSQAETNGDNLSIIFSDAAGAEWCDLTVNLQTAAQTLDEMDTVIDSILVDTAEIGAAGAGLTAINLPNQTMDITGNITGNLSGSVGSVTGAVGSVTGNVGGNVVGSVASVTAGVTLAASAVLAIWDALTSALTTAGSIGKLLVDNVNATVSSRASQTSVDTIDDFLDTEIAAILEDTGTTIPAQITALNNLSAADVNAEVVDALNVDTYAEPAQGAPGATISLAAKIGFLYKAWRNKKTVTATTHSLFNDDAATVDHKSTVSDDLTTFTETEKTTGP